MAETTDRTPTSAENDAPILDHIPMSEWVDVYDSDQMVEVCGGCGRDWPCDGTRPIPPATT